MSYWCEECQGAGRIMDKTYEAGFTMKDCPACNGTGVIKLSIESYEKELL